MIAGRVDLIGGVGLGLDAARRRAELRTGFMLTWRLGIGRLLDFVGRQWPLKPLDPALCRIAWSELTDEIAIAHAHIDNAFVWATSRTKQIVHHSQLQQLADIGKLLLILG
ncbi:hypothetical protein D3C71_1844480 [compost metagenome]